MCISLCWLSFSNRAKEFSSSGCCKLVETPSRSGPTHSHRTRYSSNCHLTYSTTSRGSDNSTPTIRYTTLVLSTTRLRWIYRGRLRPRTTTRLLILYQPETLLLITRFDTCFPYMVMGLVISVIYIMITQHLCNTELCTTFILLRVAMAIIHYISTLILYMKCS